MRLLFVTIITRCIRAQRFKRALRYTWRHAFAVASRPEF